MPHWWSLLSIRNHPFLKDLQDLLLPTCLPWHNLTDRWKSSKDNMWRTQHSPLSLYPCPTWGQEIEKQEWSWAWEKRKGEKVFWDFIFISHYPTVIWLVTNKLFFLIQSSIARDSNGWLISPCPYLDQEPSVTLSLPCPGEERSDRVASTDFQTVLEQPVLHKHLSSSLLWKKNPFFKAHETPSSETSYQAGNLETERQRAKADIKAHLVWRAEPITSVFQPPHTFKA